MVETVLNFIFNLSPREIIAQIIGFFAVCLFVFSYQIKTRKNIILCNRISRSLYVIQYLVLGALSGAVFDIVGLVATFLAQKKDSCFVKKHLKVVILAVNAAIVTVGILMYNGSLYNLLPMFGVLFHSGAFWLTNEKHIRIISLFGSPCWLIFNFHSAAYFSALGDAMTIVSILSAMIRYDILKKRDHQKNVEISSN